MDDTLFYTVTPNPCLDINCTVQSLLKDDVSRIVDKNIMAGGKGYNVARFLHAAGSRVAAAGIIAGKNGSYHLRQLRCLGIKNLFSIRVPGEMRENYNFFLPTARC
jgi:fructose-1-phosphate kinase PfkB-like protein